MKAALSTGGVEMILLAWTRGWDTHEIAQASGLHESVVQRIITVKRDVRLGERTVFVPGGPA